MDTESEASDSNVPGSQNDRESDNVSSEKIGSKGMQKTSPGVDSERQVDVAGRSGEDSSEGESLRRRVRFVRRLFNSHFLDNLLLYAF
jgi:hypothetical protein